MAARHTRANKKRVGMEKSVRVCVCVCGEISQVLLFALEALKKRQWDIVW